MSTKPSGTQDRDHAASHRAGRCRAPGAARTSASRIGTAKRPCVIGVRGGISTPSRSAAIGGTRVARSAGIRPASSVTIVPTSSETTIVRVCSTVPLSGRSAPKALNSWSSAGASSDAAEQAQQRAANTQQHAFEDHRAQDLRARGAERAQQAELARALRDGDREGVEDDEGPNEQRDVGEDQQEGAQEAEVAFEVRGLLGGLLFAGAHFHGARQHHADAIAQLRRRDARLRGDVELVVLPLLAHHPLGLGQVRIAAPAPPKDWLPANFTMPTIR